MTLNFTVAVLWSLSLRGLRIDAHVCTLYVGKVGIGALALLVVCF